MNRKAKGNRKELEVKKLHEKQGYSVHKVRNLPYRHGDMFGCADLICINKQRIKFIAVTTKGHKSRAIRKLLSFKNHPNFLIKEAWLYSKNPKAWEIVNIEKV